MEHLTILRKSNIKKKDNLLCDILHGGKTIESRWYVHKITPWGKIKKEETIYFKESGKPVTVRANVSDVLQYENLTENKKLEIIKKYGRKIAPNTTEKEFIEWIKRSPKKNYCILIF